jgi:hypothetical protein
MAETDLLNPKEWAAYRRCSVRKLDRERADGRGCPYVRIDGRIFYRRQDVDRFIAEHVRGLHGVDAGDLAPTVQKVRRRDAEWSVAPAFPNAGRRTPPGGA